MVEKSAAKEERRLKGVSEGRLSDREALMTDDAEKASCDDSGCGIVVETASLETG
jgi:hypothetical protein